MTFEEILDQAIAMLQRRGRLTYGALKRQFQLDDAYLDDVKAELIEGQRVAVDEDGRVLVWTGDTNTAPPAAAPVETPAQPPRAYTPAYLAEKILTSRSALEGERKQVTVLFADLKGSTELIRDLDPEAAQTLLDPALQHMMDAVHRFEGTVNQVLGDGIMALFGAPVAHEDHAVRACYAALAMQTAMRRYAEEVRRSHGLEMQARVGLNSGEVVVRAIGNDLHMDYSAVGQTTHLAARMEQLATPGSIRLTAATFRLAEGLVQVTALGPVPVRGLTEPVEVFELVGASAVRGRLQASAARGLTRFVGRQQELLALQQALEQARAGHGQVVALVGEPGVGKSRTVYEFIHSHHTPGWLVLESASVSYGKATPYFPVIDLLKRYSHVEDRDDVRTIRAKVTGQVLTLDPALQDAIPALLSLLDALPDDSPFLKLDPPQRRQRTLDALKRVLLRESQVQPLLLVFEDLHWIDSETQALLNSLVESLPTARLLLLVNYRPKYQHGWGSKTYYTHLRLDPLPQGSAEEFLHALLGDDASLTPLTHLLIARTEGNPFFLEESVRTLVETGVLVGARGAYRAAQTLVSIQVPATVQAVLAARIDRLPPEEKHLLQTAAVIGHEVPLPLLAAVTDVPEADVHRVLAHLQAAEFLYETRLFPERELLFKHALTHEVAYSSLLHERRRVLHARIVEALEALAPDRLTEQVERLAHHALRGEVWDKVRAYCRQAGEKAMTRSAHREAMGYYEQALHALSHLPETRTMREQAVDLRLALVWTPHTASGDFGPNLAYLQEAEALAEALDDLGLPEDLVTEIEGRLRSQQKLLGKIVGMMCPPLFGCRTNAELCRVRGWDKNLPSRLLGALPKRSWIKRLRRLGLDVLVPLWRHAASASAATRSRWQWTWVGDDSVFKKYGEQLGLVGTWWSGQEHRVLSGIDGMLLVVVVGDGKLVVPVDFAIRRPDPTGPGAPCRDKLHWVQSMLDGRVAAFRRRGVALPPPLVVADSWFSDSKLMRHVAITHGGTLLVEGKSTYVFTLADGRQVKGGDLLQQRDWPWRHSPQVPGVRYARLRATSPTYGAVTLLVVDEHGEEQFYVLCLDTAISGPRLIRAWKRRHWIEYCFRTLKHLLATGACQVHSEEAYYGHLVLRLMGCLVLFYTSRVICKGRLTMEEIIFSLKHYWRFVDSEALELKALSQGVDEKAA